MDTGTKLSRNVAESGSFLGIARGRSPRRATGHQDGVQFRDIGQALEEEGLDRSVPKQMLPHVQWQDCWNWPRPPFTSEHFPSLRRATPPCHFDGGCFRIQQSDS